MTEAVEGELREGGSAPLRSLARFSLNQITIDQWSLDETVEACAAAGVPSIGVWRQKLSGGSVAASAAHVRAAGLGVSSLCRGGFFPAGDAAAMRERDTDNRRAVDEAAELGADLLILVCGPPVGGDLVGARRMVAEGIERLLPYARELGVRLGVEPLHPMMIGERSVVVSLGEANALAERFDDDHLGVVVDVYHVFWDPRVEEEILRAANRIVGFHVSDWVQLEGNPLESRGMMGDGIIPLRTLRGLVDATGYDGPIEVEVINRELWRLPGHELLELVRERFAAVV